MTWKGWSRHTSLPGLFVTTGRALVAGGVRLWGELATADGTVRTDNEALWVTGNHQMN